MFRTYSSTYRKHAKRGKGLPYLEYVRTYGVSATVEDHVRPATARDAKRILWRPSCFLLKHGGGTLGILSSRQFATITGDHS